jgi:putative transposase
MGRPPRIAFPGLVYHVVNRGNNRQQVFEHEADFRRYLQLLRRYKELYGFRLYHYVLMSNHVHLLLQTSDKGSISKIMQGVTLAHTKYYNSKNESSGHVWQGRFKSHVIEKDTYLLQCGRYIELNPVRAKLVHDPGEYRWSSYRFHAFGEPNELLVKDPLHERPDESEQNRQKRYREFIQDGVPKETAEEIRRSIVGERPLGRHGFGQQLEEKLLLKRRNQHRGRHTKISV